VGEFASTALLLRTYFPETGIFQSYLPLGHIWSLNVEEHSYILLSLFSLAATRFGERSARIALTVSSALCLVFFVFYKYYPPAAQSAFYLRTEVAAFPLLLSCTIFLWHNKFPIPIASAVPLLSLLGAIVLAAASTSFVLSFLGVSILLAISVNTLSFAPSWVLTALSNPILRWFGICSYSMYLWQQLFYFLGTRRFDDYGIISPLLVLLVASCSFYFFEQPMRARLSGRSTHD